MRKSTKRTIFLILGIIIVLCGVLLILSNLQTKNDVDPSLDMVYNPLYTRRYLIEQEYPAFKDFENQESFAGQSVESTIVDYDYYFAYLVHGSGLPIAQATCFRVDRAGRVFKTGLFPDPLDSYAGYPEVDPVTCKGVK